MSVALGLLLVLGLVSGSDVFVMPAKFEGLWKGRAESNIIGPFEPDSFEFSISKAPNGDYLFEDNLVYDGVMIGYQRFYVEGTGSTAGLLWYCGALSNFSTSVEQTGGNVFKPLVFPTESDDSVTFCLDSDNKEALDPFKPSCITCDCSNWTLIHDPKYDTLTIQLTMGGMTEGSNHLWTEPLERIGAAPVIQDSDMPGHGSNFSCEFAPPGRDSVPVVFPDSADVKGTTNNTSASPHAHRQMSGDMTALTSTGIAAAGCPFVKRRAIESTSTAASAKTSKKATAASTTGGYDFCYSLNNPTGFKLQWTLDTTNEVLHCSVSAPVENESTWVAIGFRPLSRSYFDPTLVHKNTGHHYNFGMAGADIVAGSTAGGIRLLYAEQYTGAPIPSDALKISNASVVYADGRMTLSFTRPLVGGYLNVNYGSDASIVSAANDILWAVGADLPATSNTAQIAQKGEDSGAECDYHYAARGLRLVDWVSPETELADEWKC